MKGDFRASCGTQEFVKTAPLNLIYIANYNVFKGRNETSAEEKLWLASLDAGHCSQNVYLYCASEGLKCVVRAGAKEKELLQTIGLNDKYQFIVAQTVGY
jgi:nitroreductase